MNTEIKIFESEEFGQIRTMTDAKGEPWFVGKDVAQVLGYRNPSKSLMDHVDDDDKLNNEMLSSLGQRGGWLINESGLYSLILSSKLESARKFKHWVTAEELPQIRRTGGYIPLNEDEDEGTVMAKALMIAQKTIEQKQAQLERKQAQLEAQRPLVVFAEAITSSDDGILIRDLAKLITQNGVAIGQNRLFYWLRVNGYLFKNETRPIQKWVEKGLFETNVTLINTNHGVKERCTTKVTGKGQRYFLDGFMSGRFHAENGNFCSE